MNQGVQKAAPQRPLPVLLKEVRACTLCAPHLPGGPRPVLQVDRRARILIVGQAPGRRVHESGVPFDDPSGERLRGWLGLEPGAFYDPALVAILPMSFCYPGSGGSGDLPPRRECARTWRRSLLAHLGSVELTLILGRHAQAWHQGGAASVTDAVRAWRRRWPNLVPMPHPSPRNRIWLRRNPWFEREVLPAVRARVAELVGPTGERSPRLSRCRA